jgi:hypothetical protein
MRASRVVEAALRTVPTGSSARSAVQQLTSIHRTHEITTPEGAARSTNLLQNKRLAVRSCSQQISTLKAICQPLPPQVIH